MKIDLKVYNNFVLFTHSGSETDEEGKVFFDQFKQISSETGIKKILVDIRKFRKKLSNMETYEYAVSLANTMRGFTIATVQNEDLYDPKKFGENVAVNRGLNLRVFQTMEEAYDWLDVQSEMDQEPNPPDYSLN